MAAPAVILVGQIQRNVSLELLLESAPLFCRTQVVTWFSCYPLLDTAVLEFQFPSAVILVGETLLVSEIANSAVSR